MIEDANVLSYATNSVANLTPLSGFSNAFRPTLSLVAPSDDERRLGPVTATTSRQKAANAVPSPHMGRARSKTPASLRSLVIRHLNV